MKSQNSLRKSGWIVALLLAGLSVASTTPRIIALVPTSHLPDGLPEWGKIPVYFVANQGQVDSRAAYYVQGKDKTLYFTSQGVTFQLSDLSLSRKRARSEVIKLDFVGARAVRPRGENQTDAVISYFKGQPDEWHTNLPTYSKIVYPGLWQGIDLSFSGTVEQLKYEFVVEPGADPDAIRLKYHGAALRVNHLGELVVSTPLGSFQDAAPVAYQEVEGKRSPVSVRYFLDDEDTYGFLLGDYDPRLPLVVDPTLIVYCGFIGGSNMDVIEAIAVDLNGNAYVAGWSFSSGPTFPMVVGPDLSQNGDVDAFVAKVKEDGSGLLYAGFIGGSGLEYGVGIALDTAGSAYIAGDTCSSEETFPVILGPDLTINSACDAFVAKVKADGTGLIYAGYIGGVSDDEEGGGIAVDLSGSAYVTGYTASNETTFPVTAGPDLSHNGGTDAFVAKVKPDGSGLVYAGFVGGSGSDKAFDITVDTTGSAYIIGETESSELTFPELVGPDLTYNNGGDVFVAKIRPNGSRLAYAGYIGGDDFERGFGIAVDAEGSAFITGYTESTEATFPELTGPDLSHNGDTDAFVARLKADGSGLLFAGYIGGIDDDIGYDIAVDPTGKAFIAGSTSSTETTFPENLGPDLTYNGVGDAFVSIVNQDGTGLLLAGYLGGTNNDGGWGIALDPEGNIYLAGLTYTYDLTFPVAVGPDFSLGGYTDGFVAKISYNLDVFLPLVVR